MKLTSAVIVTVVVVGLGIVLSVRGQESAKITAPKVVKQGASLPLQVTIDKSTNVPGAYLAIRITPVHGAPGAAVETNCNLKERTTDICGQQLPLDANIGEWKVARIVFKSNRGGLDKELTVSGDLTFDVIPHEPFTLPADAKVEIK